jgi:hypothetical protein
VWYPETARKRPLYDAKWESVYTNTNRLTALTTDKVEPNIKAGKAFIAALVPRKLAIGLFVTYGESMIRDSNETIAW